MQDKEDRLERLHEATKLDAQEQACTEEQIEKIHEGNNQPIFEAVLGELANVLIR